MPPSQASTLAGNVADLPEPALRTLQGILSNILSNPEDASRCRIKMSAPTFVAAVQPHKSALAILRTVGFAKKGDVLLARAPFFDLITSALELINQRLPSEEDTTAEPEAEAAEQGGAEAEAKAAALEAEQQEKLSRETLEAMQREGANVHVRTQKTPSTAALKAVFSVVPRLVESKRKVVVLAGSAALALRAYACLRAAYDWGKTGTATGATATATATAAFPGHVFCSTDAPDKADAAAMMGALGQLSVVVTTAQNSAAVTMAKRVGLLVLVADKQSPIDAAAVPVPENCRVVALGPDGLAAVMGEGAVTVADKSDGGATAAAAAALASGPATLLGTMTGVTEALLFHLLYRRDPKHAVQRLLALDHLADRRNEGMRLIHAAAHALSGAHDLILMFLVHTVLKTIESEDNVRRQAVPGSLITDFSRAAGDVFALYPLPAGRRNKGGRQTAAVLHLAIVALLRPLLSQASINRIAKGLGVLVCLTPAPDTDQAITFGEVAGHFHACLHAALVYTLSQRATVHGKRKFDESEPKNSLSVEQLERALLWKDHLQGLFGQLSKFVRRGKTFVQAGTEQGITLAPDVKPPESERFPLLSEFHRQSLTGTPLAVEVVLAAMPDGDGDTDIARLLQMVGPSFSRFRIRHNIRATVTFTDFLLKHPTKFIVQGTRVRRVKEVTGHVPLRAVPPPQREKDETDDTERGQRKQSNRRTSLKNTRWAAKMQMARRQSHAALLRKIGVKKKGHSLPAKRGRGIRSRRKMAPGA